MKIEFTTDANLPSYGMYRCEDCESKFYGGGPETHDENCPSKRKYEDLTFIVGPKTVVSAKKWYDENGDGQAPLLPVTFAQIKESLTPEQITSVIG